MALTMPDLPSCAGAAIWFVVHHFWFLDVRVGGLPVRLLCRLLLAALTPAVLLPGLIRSGASKALVSTLMLLQVSLAALGLWHSATPQWSDLHPRTSKWLPEPMSDSRSA